MQVIFELFAGLGVLLVDAVLVIASTIGMCLVVAFSGAVVQDCALKSFDADNMMGCGAWLGGVVGLVWSIWAASTVGFFSALLSVIALAAVVLAFDLAIYLVAKAVSASPKEAA